MTPSPSDEKPPLAALRGLVLYIEDDPLNFAVVEALLSVYPDLRLVQARAGEEGVRLARSGQPDVVLLDMHLPDISGIEVVRRLSEDIAAGAFRVILLTMEKLNIDVLKAMSLGAFEYLVKPVSRPALEAALDRALAVKAGRKTAHPPGSRA